MQARSTGQVMWKVSTWHSTGRSEAEIQFPEKCYVVNNALKALHWLTENQDTTNFMRKKAKHSVIISFQTYIGKLLNDFRKVYTKQLHVEIEHELSNQANREQRLHLSAYLTSIESCTHERWLHVPCMQVAGLKKGSDCLGVRTSEMNQRNCRIRWRAKSWRCHGEMERWWLMALCGHAVARCRPDEQSKYTKLCIAMSSRAICLLYLLNIT